MGAFPKQRMLAHHSGQNSHYFSRRLAILLFVDNFTLKTYSSDTLRVIIERGIVHKITVALSVYRQAGDIASQAYYIRSYRRTPKFSLVPAVLVKDCAC